MDEWNPDERRRLASLGASAEPPAELELATLRRLRARGLLDAPAGARGGRGARPSTWRAAAALLLAFGLGALLGAWPAGTRSPLPAEGRRYVLLLRPAPGGPPAPDELERRVAEYRAWAQGKASGVVDGTKLGAAAHELRRDGGGLEVAALAEGERDLVGYFVLRARDDAHALERAAGCPHLAYGGRVELRAVEETD